MTKQYEVEMRNTWRPQPHTQYKSVIVEAEDHEDPYEIAERQENGSDAYQTLIRTGVTWYAQSSYTYPR